MDKENVKPVLYSVLGGTIFPLSVGLLFLNNLAAKDLNLPPPLFERGGEKFDIIYYIGSSDRDRRAALSVLGEHPKLAARFVFIDTCHWKF